MNTSVMCIEGLYWGVWGLTCVVKVAEHTSRPGRQAVHPQNLVHLPKCYQPQSKLVNGEKTIRTFRDIIVNKFHKDPINIKKCTEL